ncbi:MAG: hypothetical protein ACI4MH_02935 [Candidatus Coproplasma sp.]
MEDVRAEVCDFIDKCEEFKSCKFIMATTKIKDLLKSIVNSRALYELFTSASSGFNYPEAKTKYLLDVSDGFSNRGTVVLPESVTDRIAFIFCLLVEFDRDTINFNWFLQKYFADDGSFYGSYYAFCEYIINGLEQAVKGIFKKELASAPVITQQEVANTQSEAGQVAPDAKIPQLLSTISLLIAQEKQFILESPVPDDDKEAGYRMLSEIFVAIKNNSIDTANALICGYNYYILYNNCISDSVQTLFEKIEELEGIL